MESKKAVHNASRKKKIGKREAYYKIAFIKRNTEKWNELMNELRDIRSKAPFPPDYDYSREETKELMKRFDLLHDEFKKYFPENWFPLLEAGCDFDRPEIDLEVSPLSIRLFRDDYAYHHLHREMDSEYFDDIVAARNLNKEYTKGPYPKLAIDAVNLNENTIPIEIHLDRKKEDILRDVGFLLDVLHQEAKEFHIDLGRPKKPQWDVYDKYLQVYDLKKANSEMEWSEIAKIIFPEEVARERKPTHRKIRKKELATNSAVSKVFRYWKEANKMVNKGGWKQI